MVRFSCAASAGWNSTDPDTKAFCLSLVRKTTIKNDIRDSRHGWPTPFPRKSNVRNRPESQFRDRHGKFKALALTTMDSSLPISTTEVSRFADKTSRPCEEATKTWCIRSFTMLDAPKATTSHLSPLRHVRSVTSHEGISPDRRFMTELQQVLLLHDF